MVSVVISLIIREEHGIQCMLRSSKIISEIQRQIQSFYRDGLARTLSPTENSTRLKRSVLAKMILQDYGLILYCLIYIETIWGKYI